MADRFELRLRDGISRLIESVPGEHPRWATSPASGRIASISLGDQSVRGRFAARLASMGATRWPTGALAWLVIVALLLALVGLAVLAGGGRTDRALVLVPTPSPWRSQGLLVNPFVADATGDVEALDGTSAPGVNVTVPPVSPAIDITRVQATEGADWLAIDVALDGEAGPDQYVVLVALFPPDRPAERVVEMGISCDRTAACAPDPSTIFFDPVAFTYSIRAADRARVVSFVVALDELARASHTPIGHGQYTLLVHTWLRAPLPTGWWFADHAPEDGPGVPIPRGEAP